MVKEIKGMKRKIFVHSERCTGCMICMMACCFRKSNTFNPARSRIRIINWEEKGAIVPILCQHCEEPVCLPCCPVEAISKDVETGLVEINRDICINCNMCRKACPFGGPSLDPVAEEVVICDLCKGDPACVSTCPTAALEYTEVDSSSLVNRRKGMGEIRKTVLKLEGA